MNTISERFHEAIIFLIAHGYAKNSRAIANSLGVQSSVITMTKKGDRVPTWDLLLKFCDIYPINFWWLRSGEGEMVGNGDRVIALLQTIGRLEEKIREIEGQKAH